jgi:hypothetical protein
VGIKLDRQALKDTYERAIRDARDPKTRIDQTWASRIRWLSDEAASGDAKGRTYIPAVGGALLAKSVDAQADLLTQAVSGGPKGYYLRGVAELMQSQGRGIVHLGTPSANPMNNAPFLRGNARVDRLTVAGYLKHVYDTYLDWLREADKYTSAQAYAALVAFVSVRIQAQQDEDAINAAGTRMTAAASASSLLEAVQLWITEDPEEGARGQALVAAALSLVWDDIEVVPKHHPAPFDVRSPDALACEVKQKAIGESDVLELARRAANAGYDLALYAAVAADQKPLAVDRLRRDALDQHGVLIDVIHDAHELIGHLAVNGGVTARAVLERLPQALANFAPDAGVSAPGLQRLIDLLSQSSG